MKVLILSCNTGSGHNGAAQAIADEFVARGISCEVKNALSFAIKPEEDIIVDGYNFVFKHMPTVWKAGYTFAEEHTAYPMYVNFAAYATPLKRYIEKGGYDAVISTHLFPALMMTRIRRKYAPPVKQFFVCTDYSCCAGYDLPEEDRLFIPKDLAEEYLFRGADPNVLMETGIPVRMSCYERVTKEAARGQLAREWPAGVPADGRVVLVGPGTLEFDELKALVAKMPEDLADVTFVVITGKENATMRSQISRLANPHLKALSFTTHMDLWMKAADLLVTKPGGLTSTEAVTCGVPLFLLDVRPGLETHNKDYYVSRGCAAAATGMPAVYAGCVFLLRNPGFCAEMVARQRELFSTPSVKLLADEVVRVVGE